MYIEQKTSQQIHSPAELLSQMKEITSADRRNMWSDVAELFDISPQQAHDYYHNTWTKQFFENAKEYQADLHRIFEADPSLKQMTKQNAAKAITEKFIQENPNK